MHIGFFFGIHDVVFVMSLASARLMPVFILLPFFNNNTLTGVIRMPVAMIIGVSLWPLPFQELPEFGSSVYLGLMAKEVLLGLLIACFLCWPFWVLHAVGSMIDNQRGATLSSTIDPLSGVDTSELANFFNLFAAVIMLESGGLLLMLQVFHQSYQLWNPLSFSIPSLQPSLSFLGKMTEKALIMASPLLVSFLLAEGLLGLLSRFAPQMNAFSIALTVKSSIAFLLLILYFPVHFPTEIIGMRFNVHSLVSWVVS
ncbi:type III secretion system export apparatus subunit SctT [Serratia marcescens]|uniref:type III secretion system export apparatus subunit SctT n=1 Tax=Serratia marcescens TaxID=615 RepID=UPI00148D4FC1|nr:type III secretion system export apparatus subunit SctT [Serratia marcescens]QJU42317.1 SpaR/YscT/HrcT type III secretion system export apparatus protein [Serratia marcescens]